MEAGMVFELAGILVSILSVGTMITVAISRLTTELREAREEAE